MAKNDIKIEDCYILDHSREVVWEKLNDPEILVECIKGCTHVERESPKNFKATIRAQIGEIKKDFKINLDVDDQKAPAQYALSTQAGAGMFGVINGVANIKLSALGETKTELTYTALISASGLLNTAIPLIEGAAGRRIRLFFDAFVERA